MREPWRMGQHWVPALQNGFMQGEIAYSQKEQNGDQHGYKFSYALVGLEWPFIVDFRTLVLGL